MIRCRAAGHSNWKILLELISRKIDAFAGFTGKSISWLTLAMVFVTCLVVLARYLFNLGSIGLQESVMYMHGAVFMLGIAYTLKEKGHVRVDVLYERMSVRSRAIVDLIGNMLFLMPVATFILWTSLDYVSFSWSLTESSGQPGGLPGVFLLKTLIPVMAALLILQGISEILKAIVTIKTAP